MPRRPPSKAVSEQETKLIGEKLDRIDDWLNKMLDCFPQKGELTVEERKDWYKDLGPFPLPAIDNAFETHRRNALFFPIYGQIIDLCISWDPPSRRVQPICNSACRERHYRGYHWNDFYWILAKLKAPCIMGPRMARKKPVISGEIEKLMVELDSKRPGGAPEWRR